MRRKVVSKSGAIMAVCLIFAALIILSLYPLRLWQRTITDHGDAEVVQTSEKINDYHDVVQKFIARYDRIDSIDVYVNSLDKGKYMSVVVYKPTMEVYYETYIYLGDCSLPGYVTIPLKLDLEVGETYTLLINGCLSSFTVGYGAQDLAVYPYVINFSYHDTEVPGICLAAKYNYSQPIDKKTSMLLIVLVAAVASAICAAVRLIYKNRADKLITVHRVVRFVGNPIAALVVISLMVMVFPLQIFDKRPLDILFYELGIVISGGFIFYAINHENDATLEVKLWHNVHNFLKMGAIAAAMWFCCEYMNALFTIYQTLAERKEMIFLLIFLCLMIPKKNVLKLYNLIYCAAAVAAGLWYRSGHLLADTEKEYDLHNAATTYAVVIAVISGFLVLNLLIEIGRRLMKGNLKFSAKNVSVSGIMLILLFITMIVFRNTRWWGVVLAVFSTGLMLCYGLFESENAEGRKGFPELIAGGLLLNFVVSVIYCWLFRCFAAFNTGRYPFVFHTVTVTAEYMTVMVCASMVLLLYKIYETRNKGTLRQNFKYLWKEFILFGFTCSYMIFTISRTAYFACIVMAFFAFVLTSTDNKGKKFAYMMRQLGIMALSVILCFPAAFTLQRIFPAISGHPKTFLVENANFPLNGGGNPASAHYMGVERFADLFVEKIFSGNLMDYNYPEDKFNYDENGNPIYGETGVLLTEDQSQNHVTSIYELVTAAQTSPETKKELMEAAGEELGIGKAKEEEDAAQDTEAAQVEEAPADEPAEDAQSGSMEEFSNGRLTIFKSYLEQMSPWGHEEMGATLPSGEIAIHAHNTYIQVMYDNGIAAGIIFFVLIAVSAISGGVYYVKHRNDIPAALLPYAMTICFAIAAVSEWVFQFSNPMTVALILSIMPVAIKKH